MKHDLFDNRPRVRRNRLPSNPETGSGAVALGRFPSWLHRKLPKGNSLLATHQAVDGQRLHTVCEEAKCPNMLECWSAKTATFLILGKECTRACGFCDIGFNHTPPPPDPDEPQRVAQSAKELGLRHVVITMVARDDLSDGGAAHLAAVIHAVRKTNPESTVEVLTSDLSGKEEALLTVIEAKPEIFNHNIETVRDLTHRVRHKATYERTLELLSRSKSLITKHLNGNYFVKSGIMVGLGENEAQVKETLCDLRNAGVDIVTMGQYLQASPKKLRVQEFVTPEQFAAYEEYGKQIGIPHMYCGPFVRSSYNAGRLLDEIKQK